MIIKKIVGMTMAVLLAIQPLAVYASTDSISVPRGTVPPSGGGGGIALDRAGATYRNWGWRLTFGDNRPVIEENIQPLESGYTDADLLAKRNEMINIANKRYWSAGQYGLYLYDSIKPKWRAVTSMQYDAIPASSLVQRSSQAIVVSPAENKLGLSILNNNSLGVPFDDELYKSMFATTKDFGSVDDWLFFVKDKMAARGMPMNSIAQIQRIFDNGTNAARNLKNFSFDETTDVFSSQAPSDKVNASFLGYLSTLIYVTLAAQEVGDSLTYESMKNELWNWRASNYDPATMPILIVEPTHLTTVSGMADDVQNKVMAPLPWEIYRSYGQEVLAGMQSPWLGTEYANFDAALQRLVGNSYTKVSHRTIQEMLGYSWEGGTKYDHYTDRAYATITRPTSNAGTKGYMMSFTYYVKPPVPGEDNNHPAGSFTWDLDPKGTIDVSPDTVVDRSSTVYKWNVSQNGQNANNYPEWENWIKSDNSDSNRIRLGIFRKEGPENLTRNEVRTLGVQIPTQGNWFRATGATISGVPGLGTVQAFQDVTVTDEQLLNILKVGTGMSYTEPVVGDVEHTVIKGTYALTVEIGRGNESYFHLSNNQAEFVEYKSQSDTYTYLSDAPEGFAELKTGEFTDTNYHEPFEAMSGTPTTRDLYFTSGGQEFVAQITYKFTENQSATRYYEQKYTREKSAGYYHTSEQYTDISPSAANSLDWTSRIEGKTQKTETWDNGGHFIHYNTTGPGSNTEGNHIDYPTSYSKYDMTINTGDGLWEIVDLKIKGTYKEPDKTQPDGTVVAGETKSFSDESDIPSDAEDVHVSSVSFRRVATLTDHYDPHRRNTSVQGDPSATSVQASIKFSKDFTDFNVAKILTCHVWRLEKSQLTGVQKLIKDDTTDMLEAEVVSKSNALFNIAEENTAAEGRMYYHEHPEDGDHYVFKQTLKTRGSSVSYNYLAGIDLIGSSENPNNIIEDATVVSDYLILEMTRQISSLLYHEYVSGNVKVPLLRIDKSEDPQSNSYKVSTIDGFNTDSIKDQTTVGNTYQVTGISYADAQHSTATQKAICANNETFKGARIGTKDLGWGGYNGKYYDTLNSGVPGKYMGMRKHSSNFDYRNKTIFKQYYTHAHQGEVNGYTTGDPQQSHSPQSPMRLVYNNIDVHDTKVENGLKKMSKSTIFYHNIISYGDSPQYSESSDNDYKSEGFQVDTNYRDGMVGINNIIIHNPVSSQYADLISPDDKLDQRVTTMNSTISSNINANGQLTNRRRYVLDDRYTGPRYYTMEDYAEVRGTGLANMRVEGQTVTQQVPIVTPGVDSSGSVTYGFTGNREVFTAPETGTYHIRATGAKGADNTSTGGKGATVEGNVQLQQGQSMYIYVGGAGDRPMPESLGRVKGSGAGAQNGGGLAAGGTATNPGGSRFGLVSNFNNSGGGASSVSFSEVSNFNHPFVGAFGYTSPGAYANKYSFSQGVVNRKVYVVGQTAPVVFGTNFQISATGNRKPKVDIINGQPKVVYYDYKGNRFDHITTLHAITSTASATYDIDFPRSIADNLIGTAQGTGNPYFVGDFFLIAAGGGAGSFTTRHDYNDLKGYDANTMNGEPNIGDRSIGGTQSGAIHATSLIGGGGAGFPAGHPHTTTVSGKYMPWYGTYGGTNYYTNKLENATEQIGTGTGDGSVVVTWNIQNSITTYINQTTGTFTYNTGDGEVFAMKSKPQVFTAPYDGRYSIHLYGGASGRTGRGGYVGGQIALHQGDKLLVMAGGKGDATAGSSSGGYNGGGSDGGGGGSDISKLYSALSPSEINGHSQNGQLVGDGVNYTDASSSFSYQLPGSEMYRIDIVGDNLHTANIDSSRMHVYKKLDTGNGIQIFAYPNANNDPIVLTKASTNFKIKEVYVTRLSDRIAAAGGGGIDSDGGATGGIGWAIGTGTDGGGGGWWGNYANQGGTSDTGSLENSVSAVGQNDTAGYVSIVYPGKGEVPSTRLLSGHDPHKAPNTNWQLYTYGWKHENGYDCEGVGCRFCAAGVPLYSPAGVKFDTAIGSTAPNSIRNNSFVYMKDGRIGLTLGNDTQLDDVGYSIDAFDKYTTDMQNYLPAIWKSTETDGAAFNTQTSINPAHHYPEGDPVDWRPVDDAPPIPKKAPFVILDYDFEIYFPNRGDFKGNDAFAIANVQKQEGLGYINNMDTTEWLKEKYVLFPFDVTYKGKTYTAGNPIMLGSYDGENWHDDSTDGSYKYKFHMLLNNSEAAGAKIQMISIAKNTPSELLENQIEDHNYTRYAGLYRAYHDALKIQAIDIVGRIGVLQILDTGDFRFSNFYKQAIPGQWRIPGVVNEVDKSRQNFVSVDQKTIFDDDQSAATNGQNTWGTLPWLQDSSKLIPFPLAPANNNVHALKNQAHRIGYPDFMSLITTGNYYGENNLNNPNSNRVQIQPYYYFYNIKTRQFQPIDVYINNSGTYEAINKYASLDQVPQYQFNYNMNWVTEAERRMYSGDEVNLSEAVRNEYVYNPLPTADESVNITLPQGLNWIHGNAQRLQLTDRNRTFIGTRNRYGQNTEPDNLIQDHRFNRQAQRWHFTLGLPSSAVFVKAGEQPSPASIKAIPIEDGVILCALDIYSKGTVWTLHYDGTPVGDQKFYLYDNRTTLIDWSSAGSRGPGSKRVVVVYDGSNSSKKDLDTRGTH